MKIMVLLADACLNILISICIYIDLYKCMNHTFAASQLFFGKDSSCFYYSWIILYYRADLDKKVGINIWELRTSDFKFLSFFLYVHNFFLIQPIHIGSSSQMHCFNPKFPQCMYSERSKNLPHFPWNFHQGNGFFSVDRYCLRRMDL